MIEESLALAFANAVHHELGLSEWIFRFERYGYTWEITFEHIGDGHCAIFGIDIDNGTIHYIWDLGHISSPGVIESLVTTINQRRNSKNQSYDILLARAKPQTDEDRTGG